jgi:hypothetical protein
MGGEGEEREIEIEIYIYREREREREKLLKILVTSKNNDLLFLTVSWIG